MTESPQTGLKIVDGQHRVAALAMLNAEGVEGTDNVLVEVFQEGDKEGFAEGLFTEINRAEPVKFVDMPGNGVSEGERMVLEEGEHIGRVFTVTSIFLTHPHSKFFLNSQL